MKIEYAPERGRGFVRPGETGKPQNWGFSGIKKAAPKWSRLSEQITRCAVCVCDPKHKHGDDSRYQAGGQGYQPGGRFLPDLSLRGYFSTKSSRANFSGGAKRGAGGGIFVLVSSSSSLAQASDCLCRMISSSCVCVSCIGDSVLLVMLLPCKAMRRSTSHHGADSDYSDSLALRRWRRLISPRMAVTMNCASVSFSSLTKFISLKTSRGTLAVFCCDLLLVVPVGITGLLTVRWRSVYAEKKIKKGLKCKSPESSIAFKGDLHQKATPRSARNTCRASNHKH